VEAPIDTDNHGVFFLNSRVTRDDLKDGAAHTLFIGEKIQTDADLGWISGTPSTLRNTGTPLNIMGRAAAWGAGSPPWLFGYAVEEARWDWSNQQVDPLTGEMVTVESNTAESDEAQMNKKPNPELEPDEDGLLKHSKLGGDGKNPLAVGGFASSHSGGVNFALGDGSVRFVADNASASLMGRLAHREDGNVIDARELP
jgi:prepilin-type processing-associated H-X9-DG protein